MNFKLPKILLQFCHRHGCIIAFFAFLIPSITIKAQSTKRDNYLQQISLYKKALDFNSKDTLYIDKLIELAQKYRYQNLDSLALLSNESLILSEKAEYINGQIESYRNIGSFYSDKGKTTKAIFYLNKAYDLATLYHNPYLRVKALNDLAGEYSYQGNYSLSLKGYLEAIEIAEKINYTSLLSILNENMANLYLSQKDYGQAMVFFKKVKIINEEIGNPIYMAQTMSNIASAYADMNELDLAMFNINNSISIFEKEKIFEWLAYCYEIKGKIYLKKKKNTWALYWYKQSEMLHGKIEDERGKISLLNGMAEALLNLNNDSIAEVYALESYKLSKKLDYKTGIKECTNLLYTINKNKRNYETALSFHEIFQATSDSLLENSNKKAFNVLKTKMEYNQQQQQLILENEKVLARQEKYIYIIAIILAISLIVVLIVRRNERIQKRLNAELLSKKTDLEEKQAYLNELNQTKNKLFSIIGHDLRGPIGAFQGLLKLFKEGEMTKKEFLNFVPKLKVDIDTISFTLNNLLSWGQTQMNGAVTTPSITSLDAIVQENIALLSEITQSKSIKIINRVETNCLVWSDPNQMDIIIRNLISNALKFTPNNGQIIIGAIQKLRNCEVYIKDNGIGMNENILNEIFQKDANHTTYGTNNEKGTGLGLSLCKDMIEKNKGKVWAHSALGKGSTFYFTIPRVKQKYKKSA